MNPAPLIAEWYRKFGRSLPWRETKAPYQIWISEIILQQTRVDQGKGYYLRFIEKFPDLQALSEASIDEVLKAWEGLGYYSRARNLHHAAQDLHHQYDGNFPEDHHSLMKLKGIGPYTSRAISSIAFGEKVAVVDGNVLRVISRYLGDPSPIDLPKTKKAFQEQLDEWILSTDPSDFNQGIMDLGATVCTPRNPLCEDCPVQTHCNAYRKGNWEAYPVKAKKLKRKTRYFHFYFVEDLESGSFIVRMRPLKGLWGGLWEIPNEEVNKEKWAKGLDDLEYLGEMKHVFTHFDMMMKVYRQNSNSYQKKKGDQFISRDKISSFAFSRGVQKIFEAYIG